MTNRESMPNIESRNPRYRGATPEDVARALLRSGLSGRGRG